MATNTAKLDDYFSIIYVWSKAGVGTNVVVESILRKNRIVFDIGATPCFDKCIKARVVLISHGHIDHIGAIFSHARAHFLIHGGSYPTYFCPKILNHFLQAIVSKLERVVEAMNDIDTFRYDDCELVERKSVKIKIIGVEAGDEIDLRLKGERLFLRAFSVDHCGVPALGYIIGRRVSSKLKPEYQHLSNNEIRNLLKNGISIKEEEKVILEIAYTGDTCANGLIAKKSLILSSEISKKSFDDASYLHQAITNTNILFCELTFLDNSITPETAAGKGHMHVLDLKTVFSSYDLLNYPTRVRKIIFFHLSHRYTASSALNKIISLLPTEFSMCCEVAVAALISDENAKERNLFLNTDIEMLNSYGCVRLCEFAKHSK